MAVEVSRHFNQAIRWTFMIEIDLVAVKRVLNYIQLEPEEKESKNSGDVKEVTGDLEFKNVEMRY
jgi:hypothetical protein